MNDQHESPSNGSRVKIGVIVLCIVGAAALLYSRTGQGGQGVERVYFYDLATGDVFPAPASSLPPITAPGGGQAVRATVFGCGNCSADNRRIGYLTSYTDAARALQQQLLEPQPQPAEGEAPKGPMVDHSKIEQGTLVAAVPDASGGEPQWYPMLSEQGRAVIADAFKVCEGTPSKPCTP